MNQQEIIDKYTKEGWTFEFGHCDDSIWFKSPRMTRDTIYQYFGEELNEEKLLLLENAEYYFQLEDDFCAKIMDQFKKEISKYDRGPNEEKLPLKLTLDIDMSDVIEARSDFRKQ